MSTSNKTWEALEARLARMEESVAALLSSHAARADALKWDKLEFATVQEVAEKFRVTAGTVRAWIRAGSIPAVQLKLSGARGYRTLYRIPKWWMLGTVTLTREHYERVRSGEKKLSTEG